MNKKTKLTELILAFLVIILSSSVIAEGNDGTNSSYLSEGQTLTDDAAEMSLRIVEIGDEDGTSYADVEIFYTGRDSYDGMINPVGNNGFYPNIMNYPAIYSSDLRSYAKTLYRTHYTCDGKLMDVENTYEIINLSNGYANFVCRNRQKEQCYMDGSFDAYYDERCDFGVVRFYENETKSAENFAVKAGKIDTESKTAEISFSGTDMNVMTGEPEDNMERMPNQIIYSENTKTLSEEDYQRLMEALRMITEIYAKMNSS